MDVILFNFISCSGLVVEIRPSDGTVTNIAASAKMAHPSPARTSMVIWHRLPPAQKSRPHVRLPIISLCLKISVKQLRSVREIRPLNGSLDQLQLSADPCSHPMEEPSPVPRSASLSVLSLGAVTAPSSLFTDSEISLMAQPSLLPKSSSLRAIDVTEMNCPVKIMTQRSLG